MGVRATALVVVGWGLLLFLGFFVGFISSFDCGGVDPSGSSFAVPSWLRGASGNLSESQSQLTSVAVDAAPGAYLRFPVPPPPVHPQMRHLRESPRCVERGRRWVARGGGEPFAASPD